MQDKDLQKVKPDFILSASELQGAFEADEAAASSNYINKIIEVSGEIESVKKGENQTLVVTLKTENPVSAVSCTFRTISGKPEFKAGDYISLRGQCSGFLMDVIMNNCTVVNKETDHISLWVVWFTLTRTSLSFTAKLAGILFLSPMLRENSTSQIHVKP
jgi:hypothetical protein